MCAKPFVYGIIHTTFRVFLHETKWLGITRIFNAGTDAAANAAATSVVARLVV